MYYQQTVTNTADTDIYVGDVLLYELTDLKAAGLDPDCCRLFRSGRHKNDMPSVCTFGVFDDAMKDCLCAVSENGTGMTCSAPAAGIRLSGAGPASAQAFPASPSATAVTRAADPVGGVIISDHLTILGSDDNALFIAFMTGEDQLLRTEILVDTEGRFLRLRAYTEFNCMFRPGESRTTELLSVEHVTDTAAAIRSWALARRSHAPLPQDCSVDTGRASLPKDCSVGTGSSSLPQDGSSAVSAAGEALFRTIKKRPAVFCTWYYYGLSVTMRDVALNLDLIKKKDLPFTVFQIDDGWEITLGDWTPNLKFPVSMCEVAAQIRDAGLTPGIWTSPFVTHASAPVCKDHPDWILRNADGEPLIFSVNGGDYLILDITLPAVRSYVEALYRMLTMEWGFTYHKLDFTRAPLTAEGAVYGDPYITPVHAYREAMKAVRRGMGDDSYMLVCGGLYDPLIGICDAQRSSSDVLSMWRNNVCKDLKAAPFTIKQNILRYYMNCWWHNDPDALMVRRNSEPEFDSVLTYGLLTDDEVRTLTLNQLIGGGLVCCTEPLDRIDDDRLAVLKHILPIHSTEVEAVGLMSSARYPNMVRIRDFGEDTDGSHPDSSRDHVRETGHCNAEPLGTYLVIINWDDDVPLSPVIPVSTITGRTCEETFTMTDFYSGASYTGLTCDSAVTLAPIPPHAATIIGLSRGDRTCTPDPQGHYLFLHA